MKRIPITILLSLFLFGCGSKTNSNIVISTRAAIHNSEKCSFYASVTADYTDQAIAFKMNCLRDNTGSINVTVTEPESISGITGRICDGSGQLIFDETVLAVELVADGAVSPIATPWLFMEALLSGYISYSGPDGDLVRTRIDDTYSGVQYSMDLWQDNKGTPVRAEIIWEGRRILSIDIDGFTML